MKKTVLMLLSVLIGYYAFCQTGLVENFNDGGLTGWTGQADYELTNVGSELEIVTHKTSTWNSFQYNFSPIDISANPFVSLKVKTDIDFNLNFSVWDNQSGNNYAYPVNDEYQSIISSDDYATYTFDFRNVSGVDLTKINRLNFVFNPNGAQGCNSTVYFDDIKIGDQSLVMPAITAIPDQFHGLNPGAANVPFWGIKDRLTGSSALSITATSSNTALIPDPSITYNSGSASGSLEYTPVTDMSGTAVITLTVSGNAPDDNVITFNVTVESNHEPKIDQVSDQNIKSGKETRIEIAGMDDGDANANQTLIISATSSDTSLIPNPEVEYSNGDFTGLIKLNPTPDKTGTAIIRVKVQDDGGIIAEGIDTTIMSFKVNVYDELNNPPSMRDLENLSILQDSPEQIVQMSNIIDGDIGKTQGITIEASSSDTSLIPNPTIQYLTGASYGELKFTSLAGQTGTATITVTLTDNGGNEVNNGNESASYTFDVEVRVRPIEGWEDDFNDGVLGEQWPATWGNPGENTHLCTEEDGIMQIQIDKTRTNNRWAGLWFNIPTELDLSENPYISITMKTDSPPKDMLIFLWDAYDHYNTAKTVRYTVTGDFVEYFFDYSDPSFQLQNDGTVVDISRIKALLINFDPGGDSPLFQGSFFFDDFRIGDKAHRTEDTPKVTMADIPDFAIAKDSPQQNITLTNITDGGNGTSTVSVLTASSNKNLIPNPQVSSVVNNKATLTFTPEPGLTGFSNITVQASAEGSTPVSKTFRIYVNELESGTATDITIDLTKKYQEIDGFGAFMGSGDTSPDTIISLARDIGMSMARFGVIGGGFEQTNDNSDPNVINLDGYNPGALSISNMIRTAPFVDKFIVSFWSPAGWMKLNKWENGVEGYATDNKLNPKYYEEYAEEVVALLKIIKRETGKDVYGIGLQNEPQFNEPYPSCRVNPTEFRDIIKIVGARLDAEGYGNVKLFWAEALPAQNAIDDYINAVKNDPVAKSYADVVAIHNYDSDGASVGGAGCDYWNNIYNWAQDADPRYKTWMTETSGHADNWDGAMTLAGNIFNALECGNASAWVFWTFSVSEGSSQYGLVVSNRPSSRYYISKQYYKFIRPGAFRVDVASASIPTIAFEDENAETVSVILFNNTSQPQAVEIKGDDLPTEWEMYTTSSARNCEKGKNVGEDGLVVLPPSSLTTLVGGNGNPAPTIDSVANYEVEKNSGLQNIDLTGISDGEGFDQQIKITASSDNTNLIPNPTITYVDGQATGMLSYTPVEDMTGTANIILTLTDDGLPSRSTTISFNVTVNMNTGLDDLENDGISVYPNPASDYLTIKLPKFSGKNLVVTDANGKIMMTRDISILNEYKMNVQNFAEGPYWLTITGNGEKNTFKFVVK